MPNLIQQFSLDYFMARFQNTVLLGPNGNPCYISEGNSSSIVTKEVTGTIGKLRTETVRIPHDFFTDMTVFKTPELGWRTAAQGRLAVFLSRNNRGYNRGINLGSLTRWISPLTVQLMEDGLVSNTYYEQSGVKTKLVFDADYLTLAEGMRKMSEGELLSFAVSPRIMVAAAGESHADLYFSENRVGRVLMNGTIQCNIPEISTALEEAA